MVDPVFVQGYNAFHAGIQPYRNPYPSMLPAHNIWMQGWYQAQENFLNVKVA